MQEYLHSPHNTPLTPHNFSVSFVWANKESGWEAGGHIYADNIMGTRHQNMQHSADNQEGKERTVCPLQDKKGTVWSFQDKIAGLMTDKERTVFHSPDRIVRPVAGTTHDKQPDCTVATDELSDTRGIISSHGHKVITWSGWESP